MPVNYEAHASLAPFNQLVFLTVVCFSISVVASPFVAWMKGYSPQYWPLACGPIGLFIITFLMPTIRGNNSPERSKLRARANMIGISLTVTLLLHAVLITTAKFIAV